MLAPPLFNFHSAHHHSVTTVSLDHNSYDKQINATKAQTKAVVIIWRSVPTSQNVLDFPIPQDFPNGKKYIFHKFSHMCNSSLIWERASSSYGCFFTQQKSCSILKILNFSKLIFSHLRSYPTPMDSDIRSRPNLVVASTFFDAIASSSTLVGEWVSQWVGNVFRFWRYLSHLPSLRAC